MKETSIVDGTKIKNAIINGYNLNCKKTFPEAKKTMPGIPIFEKRTTKTRAKTEPKRQETKAIKPTSADISSVV
jgi:hypothetical protein